MKLEGADVQGSPQLQIQQVRSSVAKAQNKKCLLVKIKFIDKPKTLSLEERQGKALCLVSKLCCKESSACTWLGVVFLLARVLGGEGRSVVDPTS